jgi:uncharacterized protein YrrD
MDFDLGTAVYSGDGKHVGKVDRIVLSARGGPVQAVVVHSGFFFSRDVLIPVDYIGNVDDAGIHLTVSGDALHALPDFVESQYAPPPDPAAMEPTYMMGAVMYPYDAEPGVAPVVEEERSTLAPGVGDVGRGATALCSDGEAGVVRDVVVDEASGQVRYLVVDTGEDDARHVQAPRELIAGVAGDTVTLACTLAEFRALPEV